MAARQLSWRASLSRISWVPTWMSGGSSPEIFEFGLTRGERARRVRVINPRRRRLLAAVLNAELVPLWIGHHDPSTRSGSAAVIHDVSAQRFDWATS